MPPRRLLLSVAVSLALHAATLGAGAFAGRQKPPPAPLLHASLRLPASEIQAAAALVKNTLTADETKPEPLPPPAAKAAVRPDPARQSAAAGQRAEKRRIQAAQRRLAEHTYYPPEAIARGIEGDVRLLLVLADDGAVADVHIAASSGHALLDRAAVGAAYAMGRLPGAGARELILPVSFRLR